MAVGSDLTFSQKTSNVNMLMSVHWHDKGTIGLSCDGSGNNRLVITCNANSVFASLIVH